jgi:hypothetical protein
MAPKKTTTTRPAKQQQETTTERVKLRATLDGKGSMPLLRALAKKFQLKRSPTVAYIVSNIKGSKSLQNEFKEFYLNLWPALEPRKIDTSQLLSLPQDADDELKRLSWNVLSEGNKSETLRVLIHFFAHKNKLTVEDGK